MAAGIEVPKGMYIHGFLLMEGHKMSKSLGNVLDPHEVIDEVRRGRAPLLLLPRGLIRPGRPDLSGGLRGPLRDRAANEYGNLANRTLSMIGRYRDGAVPEAEAETDLAEAFEGAVGRISELLDASELTQALEEVWKLVRRLNQYVEETRPWDLAKDESASGRLDSVLYGLAEGLRVTTLLLHAYMPESTAKLLDALGEPGRELASFGSRGGGASVERIPPLFPKLDT